MCYWPYSCHMGSGSEWAVSVLNVKIVYSGYRSVAIIIIINESVNNGAL